LREQRPNLLWIMTDHLRHQALGCNGDPNARTPNLDRLAAQGTVCELAFSHYPVCTPFRAGLLTGQYNHINGVRVHGDLLPPDRRTIAHAFRRAGYRTSYVGKWHLASTNGLPSWQTHWCSGDDYWVHPYLRGGFEDWFAFDLSNNYYNTYYSTGESVEPVRLEGYQTDSLTDLSLKYLSETAVQLRQPWFHVLSFESPHPGMGADGKSGYPAPPAFQAMFRPHDLVPRENVPDDVVDDARAKAAGYYAMVANIDHNVGRILNWLDDNGLAENTLVVFFADHGEMLGSHGLYDKIVPYEESIHIPLILRLPGSVPAGKRYEGLVSGIDIFPTCAGFCGVPVFPEVQGIDQSLSVCGSRGHPRSEVLIQWLGKSRYNWGDHPYRAIRTNHYTYCLSSEATNQSHGGHFRVLFDNAADPLQMDNLFGRCEASQLQRSLHVQLCHAIRESGEELPAFVREASDMLGLPPALCS